MADPRTIAKGRGGDPWPRARGRIRHRVFEYLVREPPRLVGIPVLFLTGLALEKARAMVPPDPSVRFLSKPPDWSALIRTVREMLGEIQSLGLQQLVVAPLPVGDPQECYRETILALGE